ncbi:hypothetical protein HanRHA438_Chr11g0520661 [Helianthus annuus]|nr:hypothetical protein HanRHA438_Chr11g0520661 [Helianthus annuus]
MFPIVPISVLLQNRLCSDGVIIKKKFISDRFNCLYNTTDNTLFLNLNIFL